MNEFVSSRISFIFDTMFSILNHQYFDGIFIENPYIYFPSFCSDPEKNRNNDKRFKEFEIKLFNSNKDFTNVYYINQIYLNIRKNLFDFDKLIGIETEDNMSYWVKSYWVKIENYFTFFLSKMFAESLRQIKYNSFLRKRFKEFITNPDNFGFVPFDQWFVTAIKTLEEIKEQDIISYFYPNQSKFMYNCSKIFGLMIQLNEEIGGDNRKWRYLCKLLILV